LRHIRKRQEPKTLTAWKATANEDWTPSYDQLRSPEKPILHQALLEEQGHVCCYCEARIDIDNSHIEHFRPQSHRNDLALEYSNLFASCGRPKHAESLPQQCGNKKADWYEEVVEDVIASPLSRECEWMFTYTRLGEIGTTHDSAYADKALRTIALLGLDNELLNAGRQSAIDTLISFSDDLEQEELRLLLGGLVRMDQYGRHEPFATTLIYFGREYLGVPI
jgi:uncharacterized protein (TIGR02646 family)